MRHRLVQCLCPNRHCIVALAIHAQADGLETDEGCLRIMEGAILELVGEGALHPWCGICRQPLRSWIYEVKPLPEGNWAALTEKLSICQQRQREAARILQFREKARMN